MTSIQSALVADCAALQRTDDAIKHVLSAALPTSCKLLLVAIIAGEGATQKQLGESASLKPRQAGTLIKKLCDEGWIERQRRGGAGGGRLPDAYAYLGQTAKIAHCVLPSQTAIPAFSDAQTARIADCALSPAKTQELPIADCETTRAASNAQSATLDFGEGALLTTSQDSSEKKKQTPKSEAPKGEKRSRGSRIEADWKPNAASVAFAAARGFVGDELTEQVEEFVCYWRAEPGAKAAKLDWDATFQNNIRRQAKFRAARSPSASAQSVAYRGVRPMQAAG